MSREILFRGKRIDDGKWIEGLTLQWGGNVDPLHEKHWFLTPNGYSFPNKVDSESICQYTGLTDKKDRKIFEGDIVKTNQYGVDNGNGRNCVGFDIFSIEFTDGGFRLKNKLRSFNLRSSSECEVVGNIFDNPELMHADC